MGREARAKLLRQQSVNDSAPRRQQSVNDSTPLEPSNKEATAKRPRQKISEHLVSIAGPWRDRLDPDPPLVVMSLIHQVAGLIWNVSRLPKPQDRERALDRIRDELGPMLPDLPAPMLSDLIREMYGIACEIDPDDTRVVAGAQTERLGKGRFHVQAASVSSSDTSEEQDHETTDGQ